METASLAAPDALTLMQRETRRDARGVPDALGGVAVAPGRYRFWREEFLLRGTGFACHYRKGAGIALRLDDPAAEGEAELFLTGSVHAAIAGLNGLVPLHASAIALAGRVIAFSGPSGAGKSTLAAALGMRGYPLFADDTLVLDPASRAAEGGQLMCLPGHKRLKLWPAGLALAGAAAQELVAEDYRKFYARTSASDCMEMLPLGALVYLAEGPAPRLERLSGAARFAAFDDEHYTAELHRQATRLDGAGQFALRAQLARAIPAWRLERPLDPARFGETLAWLERHLPELAEA